jgi:hypothetical protein
VKLIADGLWHWSARRESIGMDVSSYYLEAERVLIDAMIPPVGLRWFDEHGAPEHVLLTNRHHDRDAWHLREEFGCEVHCIANGVHELEGRGSVEPFDFGDELPGGVFAYEVDAICPDETALHVPKHGALACADGVVRWAAGGELSFVPDWLMDEPDETKQGLREAYRRLLDLEFDLLLLAHGEPVVSGGREALRHFIAAAT